MERHAPFRRATACGRLSNRLQESDPYENLPYHSLRLYELWFCQRKIGWMYKGGASRSLSARMPIALLTHCEFCEFAFLVEHKKAYENTPKLHKRSPLGVQPLTRIVEPFARE